jgi:rhodanese-related sulfurtransferase
MSTPTPKPRGITSTELHDLLGSTSARIIDVRTPAEFETAHIAGSFNVPLDVVQKHTARVAEHLKRDDDVVLVCRSGQRAQQAGEALRDEGIDHGRVLERGLLGWQSHGFDVDHGEPHWELERQVRLVAGFITLSSVVGSVALPKLKWVAAAIGGGLTYAAISDTCAMATALSKLPYNRGDTGGVDAILERLGAFPPR